MKLFICDRCGKKFSGPSYKGHRGYCGKKRKCNFLDKNGNNWNKGLTKETDERLKNIGKTISKVRKDKPELFENSHPFLNFNKNKRWGSNENERKEKLQKHSETVKNNINSGKFTPHSGYGRWYDYQTIDGKNIRIQGTYELRTCKILDNWKQQNKILDWEYTKDRIQYEYQNKIHIYLLDFKVINLDKTFYYIETKGYKTEKDEAKWKAVEDKKLDLKIWYDEDIKQIEMAAI